MAIFTVGHGTRSIDELLEVLAGAGIELVVDVRRFPASRRHPHFGRQQLERSLRDHGIAYEWLGEELGGRRRSRPGSRHSAWRNEGFRAYADHMETPVFKEALAGLRDRSSRADLALMCAETLWWRCHRRLIADRLVAFGTPVVHLVDSATTQVHEPNPAARRDGDDLVYDLGVQQSLDPPDNS